MKIYNYDKVTKEFLSEGVASVNPLEKDKYLIPANATTIEPLSNKVDFAVCFIPDKWIYVVDNRTKVYYLDKEKVIFKLGDEITADMTLEQYTAEELASFAETNTKSLLMLLCDKKQSEVQGLILGYKNTPKQLERYKDKYERAKANEWDQATNDSIIANHEAYLGAMRNLVDLIEYFRSKTDDLIIAGDLDKANEVIALAEAFDDKTTLADIDSLFLGAE